MTVCGEEQSRSERVAELGELPIDKKLLHEAHRLSGLRTKRATVHQALAEFIQRRRQLRILAYFGKINFDPGVDYKAARRRR